ncbi:TPA: response regulator, partial [Escherichia coli]|nr:response regulator [Escherichia coli]
ESYIEHRPDLILTDIELSRKSGIEACQELQAKGFDINVIFITGASDVLYPELTSEIGNIGYLVKPVTKERLINFLEKAKKKILRETSPIDTSNIKWIQARVNYRYTQVNEESIIYVEKASKYRSLLYLMKSEGYEVMESSSTLKELEIQCSDKIFRAHK